MNRLMVPRRDFVMPTDANLVGHLAAKHFRQGKKLEEYDLGFGNVQSNFVVALMNDQQGTASNLAAPLLAVGNKYMYSGTGATVNTYDYKLVTPINAASSAITPTRNVTANGTAGTDATLQYVGTTSYTGSNAVTEWGMTNTAAALTSATNLTANLYSHANASDTITSSAYTPNTSPSWTAHLYAGCVLVDTSAATTVANFILDNSATSATLAGIWYKLASSGGGGSTPAAGDTMQIWPLLIDHKTFSALNVINGDSIQWTYTLQIVSGG